MTDKILEMFFERERWEAALKKGAFKGIRYDVLREYMSPEGRQKLLQQIINGEYHIERPHTAKIPKDTPGEFRTVFVNNDSNRIFLSLVNDILFDIAGGLVHPACKSYQKGIGCAEVVRKASSMIERLSGKEHSTIGFKADLSKYFDSVPIEYIDRAFEYVEQHHGKSLILDIVKEYYHMDKYYDSEAKVEVEHYQSLKQGCAVAAWLADAVLFNLDSDITRNCEGYYVRYSDDILYIGNDYAKAMHKICDTLEKMQMRLNPKKVEYVDNDHWFKFLGYSIKGRRLSLSSTRIKTFVKEIKDRTIKTQSDCTYEQCLKKVQSWLYYGDGEHSWATGVLKTINVKDDIDQLNNFVMDCLRAKKRGKQTRMSDLGGLGYNCKGTPGCITRGKGRRVTTLRQLFPELEGYHTLNCMRRCLFFGRSLYDTVVRTITT